MVVLVPVDERLTGPGAPGLAELCSDGVEPLVEAVLRSEIDVAPSPDTTGPIPRGGTEVDVHPRTFLSVDPRDRQVVGTCGFRGPVRGGRVEIAFWTFPPFEGRGWATAMTRTLVARAFEDPSVHTVVAHTLPERAPAASVLTRTGWCACSRAGATSRDRAGRCAGRCGGGRPTGRRGRTPPRPADRHRTAP